MYTCSFPTAECSRLGLVRLGRSGLHRLVRCIKKAMKKKRGAQSPKAVAEMLRTTLQLVAGREDLNQDAPKVRELKRSIREKIASLEGASAETSEFPFVPRGKMFGYDYG